MNMQERIGRFLSEHRNSVGLAAFSTTAAAVTTYMIASGYDPNVVAFGGALSTYSLTGALWMYAREDIERYNR